MQIREFLRLLAAYVCLLIATPYSVQAQQHPDRLAVETFLSVRGNAAVKELADGRAENPTTSIERMNWIPESEQPLAYFSKLPVTPIGWREIAISFIPKNSGVVTLELYGPWDKSPNGEIFRQEVWWDDVRVTGADLKNGSFEQPFDAPGSSWKSTGAIRVESSVEVPAAEGNYLVKAWHNERVIAELAVTGGKRVMIQAKSRSVKLAGSIEMKGIVSRDTPAHKASRYLMHGVNFGNYLEVPPDQNWALNYSDEDFEQAKAEGFDHIRLPIGWNHYTGPGPKYQLSQAIFAKVDKHVESACKRNLPIIINIHHFDDFTTDPAKYRDKFFAIWNQLADHYSKMPETVVFELLNEPKDAATTVVLNPIYADVIHQIRRTNPTRTILVGPGKWNSISELANLRLPDDDRNLIVTVHNYDPFQFTHQGAHWAGPDVGVKGIRFPGPPAIPLVPDQSANVSRNAQNFLAQYNSNPRNSNPCSEALVKDLVAQAKYWSDYYGRPIHFGEFGVNIGADADSRANYVRAFREAFDEAEIGWALWDWKAMFRYWDTEHNQPSPGFREALFPKK